MMDSLEIQKILVDPQLENPGDRGVMKRVNTLAFSPNSQQLASGSDHGLILLWSVASGTCEWLETSSSQEPVQCIAYSPDGSMLAFSTDDSEGVEIQSLLKRKKSPIKLEVSGRTPYIAYHTNGEFIAAGADSLEIFHIRERESVTMFEAACVLCVAFSPDGALLASGYDTNNIDLWVVHFGPTGSEPDNIETPTRTLKGHKELVRSVTFSPDNSLLASGSNDGTARLWDVASGALLQTLEVGGTVNAVTFSPDGKFLATASSNVALWDVATATKQYEGTAHAGEVNAVAFSPAGNTLASGGNDAKIVLWKTP